MDSTELSYTEKSASHIVLYDSEQHVNNGRTKQSKKRKTKLISDSKTKYRPQKYVKKWESDPILKEWVVPVPGDVHAAMCKVCRRPFNAHKKDLVLHSRSKKHKVNFEKYNSVMRSCQPVKDTKDEPDLSEIENYIRQLKTEPEDTERNISVNDESLSIFMQASPVKRKKSGLPSTTVIYSDSDCEMDLNNDDLEEEFGEILNAKEKPHTYWRSLKEFKGWLDFEDNQIFCKVCDKTLNDNKTELLKHAAGIMHKQKCEKAGIEAQPQSNFMDILSGITNREKVIDLQSDTVTQPSEEMKKVMMKTHAGDSSDTVDSIVCSLEEKVAFLFDKEAALFLPTGTMANLIAVMAHCPSRDSEVIVGDESHLYQWSQAGITRIGGVHLRVVKNLSDGTFNLSQLTDILLNSSATPWPCKTLVCMENTHNRMGGRPLPMKWVNELGMFCEEKNLLLHMDGARLLNAAIALGETLRNIAKHCNSVTLCLNKGLGCPVGSMLVGSHDFIRSAQYLRNMMGGSIHQASMFAAAGIYSVENLAKKLHWDHAHARHIAEEVHNMHSSAVWVNLDSVSTNIVLLHTDKIRVHAKALCQRLSEVTREEAETINDEIKVLMVPIRDDCVRLMTHYNLCKRDIICAIKKIQYVINEYDNSLQIETQENKKILL